MEEIRFSRSQYPGPGNMQEGEVLDLVITILSDRLESLHVHHSINTHRVVSPRYLPVLEALPAKAYCSLPATSRRRRVPQVQVPLPPAPMTLDTPPHSSPPAVDQSSPPSSDLHCICNCRHFHRFHPTFLRNTEQSLRILSTSRAISTSTTSSSEYPTFNPRTATRRSRSRHS